MRMCAVTPVFIRFSLRVFVSVAISQVLAFKSMIILSYLKQFERNKMLNEKTSNKFNVPN